MKRVSKADATRLQQLNQQIDPQLIRTVLTPPGKRIMRPERLDNLIAGRGRLRDEEQEKLRLLSANSRSVAQLSKKQGRGNGHVRISRRTRKNRSIRDWLIHGKERGTPRPDDKEGKIDEQKAIHGLRFLGVDPSEKHYYIRKVKAA